MDGPWLGFEPTHRDFTCAFVNVVPFRNGRMQGEQLFLDLPALCQGIGLAVDDVVGRAAAAQAATYTWRWRVSLRGNPIDRRG